MNLHKIYNNNIVMCIDENNEEIILIGLGLAFNTKVGQPIDESKIERKFILDSNKTPTKSHSFFHDTPMHFFEITVQIVNLAQETLKTSFPNEVYIAICDHINFAIKRYTENKPLKNALLWEIKKYYKKEFEVASESILIINKSIGVLLGEDEAGFIALHFVNGLRNSNEMNETIKQVKMVEEVMKFVNYQLHYIPNDEDMYYQRFLVHLRFLFQRLFENGQERIDDTTLSHLVKTKYSKEYQCATTISLHIKKEYNFNLLSNEITYLALHLHRMISKEN